MIRCFLFFVFYLGVETMSYGQAGAVVWDYAVKKVAPTDYVIDFRAIIAPGWHLYSQHLGEGGPIPTRFRFEKNDDYILVGTPLEEGNRDTFYEDLYEMEITWYTGHVSFRQQLKAQKSASVVQGVIDYMTCNDQMCVPQRHTFTITLPGY